MADIDAHAFDRELKRGLAELLILSLLDARPRHGYELSKLIHARSGGQLTFHIDLLIRCCIASRSAPGSKERGSRSQDERRRRFDRSTPEGRRVPAQQRRTWDAFVKAVRRVTEPAHA